MKDKIKHRKAQSGGLMATIGQSLAGPRFSETDEVNFASAKSKISSNI